MLAALVGLALFPHDPAATFHASDARPILDPMRTITQITRTGFSIQYWTEAPCQTRLELREGQIPRTAFGHPKPDGRTFLVEGGPAQMGWHTLDVKNLKPGQRYYYRVWDPKAVPTDEEKAWGAGSGWRREFAVSTLAPAGRKTIIRLPVKVLLMPNVLNVESAYESPDRIAPLPTPMSRAEIQKIRDEYAVSAREMWVASGMRLWVDYQIVLDERWQRWGPDIAKSAEKPGGVPALLPVCRSYPGKDYEGPGGGTWTYVDLHRPTEVFTKPFVEEVPYSAQIEQAFPQRWNSARQKWDYYNSGGGTFGPDEFPHGTPGRSQFLGGGDTAWLATHEFHHDLEGHGQFSLGNREDDRIVFDHPSPRHRTVKGDGSVDEQPWTTNGRHGEHWDVMAYWDRQISDAQWLRMYFGRTETVADADEDGFPDDDGRLPLDERRFGSSPHSPATDGRTGDLAKVMESNWAPGPLQSTWTKPPFQAIRPNPTRSDSDGDGIPDDVDPYPLYPFVPFIVPKTMEVDGDPRDWAGVPLAGEFTKGGIHFTFQQAHDDNAYYGLYTVSGPWKRIDGTFDGEGNGVYSGSGVLGFQAILSEVSGGGAGPVGPLVETKPNFAGAPGLKIRASHLPNGSMAIEFSLPNRGLSPWYWSRGGNEIGAAINVWDREGRGYSVWEPYRLFYARMIEPSGTPVMPAGAPAELEEGPGVELFHPRDLKAEAGWKVTETSASYDGQDEAALYLDGQNLKDFDLLAVIEAKSDAVLAGYTKGTTKMTAGEGYVGFVGGYGNSQSKLRLFGNEIGSSGKGLSPGIHHVQLTRRAGEVWLLLDGKPVAYGADPNPRAILNRVAVLGGYGGAQVVHELRLRK